MSKKLAEIREKIDGLDDKIHDLLMKRASLIIDIAEEKRKSNMQVVHPAREAMMVRRLLSRHQGSLPQAAILSIWRELVGAVCMMQTGLKVTVAADEKIDDLWDMAKNYFGSVLPMTRSSSPLTAIPTVRGDQASFAVVPWPKQDIDSSTVNPWWSYIFDSEQEKMKIICALPYGSEEKDFISLKDKGLVVSKIDFLPSGSDHSFIGLEIDSTVSRARIFDEMKKIKLEPLAIYTKTGSNGGKSSLHFIVVGEYVENSDERIKKIIEIFPDFKVQCKAMGGYPVPPCLKPTEVMFKDV